MKIVQARATFLILSAILVLSGCHKNKPVVLLPQQPPTTASTENPPTQPPQNPQEQPQAQPQPTPGQEQANADKPPAKPAKPQSRHPRHTTTTATNKPAAANSNDKPAPEKTPADKPQEVAHNTPPRIVVQEGGSSNPGSTQIAAGSAHDDKSAHDQTTGQLLDSTDNNIRSLKRQLSADELARVAQIRDYQAQARQAVKDGDMVGAHNLAVKAHLLSEELVKQH